MDLPILDDFADATDPSRYSRLPGDWALGVCDIVGSTKLAGSGRHRDVNFVAAACVAALQAEVAAISPGPVACQFGGDGAIVAVPPQARPAVSRALAALAHWAADSFGLTLRIGMIQVTELEEKGGDVLAALYRVGSATYYGVFLGNGPALADRLLKQGGLAPIAPMAGEIRGLDGLSCRWEPVNSAKGTILCLIVDPVATGPDGAATMQELRAAIEAIAPLGLAGPLGEGQGLVPRLRALPEAIRRERNLRPGLAGWGRIGVTTAAALLVWAMYWLRFGLGRFTVPDYIGRIARQTDFRRISTGLRLVLDVSLEAADRIETLLAETHAQGRIRYGTHRCPAAAITCLVFDVMDGRHIHFVDGSGLGLWQAAADAKARAAGA